MNRFGMIGEGYSEDGEKDIPSQQQQYSGGGIAFSSSTGAINSQYSNQYSNQYSSPYNGQGQSQGQSQGQIQPASNRQGFAAISTNPPPSSKLRQSSQMERQSSQIEKQPPNNRNIPKKSMPEKSIASTKPHSINERGGVIRVEKKKEYKSQDQFSAASDDDDDLEIGTPSSLIPGGGKKLPVATASSSKKENTLVSMLEIYQALEKRLADLEIMVSKMQNASSGVNEKREKEMSLKLSPIISSVETMKTDLMWFIGTVLEDDVEVYEVNPSQQSAGSKRGKVMKLRKGRTVRLSYPMFEAKDYSGKTFIWLKLYTIAPITANIGGYWVKSYDPENEHHFLGQFRYFDQSQESSPTVEQQGGVKSSSSQTTSVKPQQSIKEIPSSIPEKKPSIQSRKGSQMKLSIGGSKPVKVNKIFVKKDESEDHQEEIEEDDNQEEDEEDQDDVESSGDYEDDDDDENN